MKTDHDKEVQESHELMKEHMRQRAEKRKLLNQQEAEGSGEKEPEHVQHHSV